MSVKQITVKNICKVFVVIVFWISYKLEFFLYIFVVAEVLIVKELKSNLDFGI